MLIQSTKEILFVIVCLRVKFAIGLDDVAVFIGDVQPTGGAGEFVAPRRAGAANEGRGASSGTCARGCSGCCGTNVE
jgi:hypothetical protein